MSKSLQFPSNLKPIQVKLAAPVSAAKSIALDLKANAMAPIQAKLPQYSKQNAFGVFDRSQNDAPVGGFNPKEIFGKLPAGLKDQADKAQGDAMTLLDKVVVGTSLGNRSQSSSALEQRVKDGMGLGRFDPLGLLGDEGKQAKGKLIGNPNGSAPTARVGAVEKRDRYSLQGDSFLMAGSGGRKYIPDQPSREVNQQETIEGAGDLAGSYGGWVAGLVSPRAGIAVGMVDMMRTGSRDFSKPLNEIDGKTVFDTGIGVAGNIASATELLGVSGNAAPVVGAFATGYAIGSALDKTTNGALSDAGAVAIEVVVDAGSAVAEAAKSAGAYVGQKVGNAWDLVAGGYVAEDGGPINPQALQKINVLQRMVNPNKPLSPDPEPRNADPLINPQRGEAAGSVRPANTDTSFFGAVNQGVICPGPEQFKSLVNPNRIDFLMAGFQQKTDALINPSRQEDGSSGGPVLQAPGRAVFGQDGFTSISTDGLSERKLNDVLLSGGMAATGTRSISTDGLSERKVSDFLLNQGAASNGFQAISTDGLSERPVVGFSLGQVPSVAQGFQAISTDGLSERSGAGQVFTAAVQGSVSADPFAATTPTSPVF